MLRLVDHDHGMSAQRNQRRQKPLQRRHELVTRHVSRGRRVRSLGVGNETEVHEDVMQQIVDAQTRIQDHGQERTRLKRAEQRAQHRLAGADFAVIRHASDAAGSVTFRALL